MKVSHWIRQYFAQDDGSAGGGNAGGEAAASEAPTQEDNGTGLEEAFLTELGIDPKQLQKQQRETTITAETETEEEEEGKKEEEEEEEADPLMTGLPEETKAKIQRRINKLTARAKAAEEGLSDAIHERDELKKKAVPAAPATAENPLAHVNTREELTAALARSEEIRDWALENWEGGEVGDGDNTTRLEAEQVRKLFKHHDAILRKHGPAQETYLKTREGLDAVARQAYPWIEDEQSGERKLYDRVLKVFPGLARSPDYALFLGDYVEGVKARMSREKAAKEKGSGNTPKPAAKPVLKLAPKPPVGGSSPAPKTPPGQKKEAMSLDKLAKSGGSEADLVEFFNAN